MVDECVKINPHGVKPGVEFHFEKILYSGVGRGDSQSPKSNGE